MSLFHTSKTWYGNSCLLFHCIVGVHIQDGSSSVITGPCILREDDPSEYGTSGGAWSLCRSYGIKSVSSHTLSMFIFS